MKMVIGEDSVLVGGLDLSSEDGLLDDGFGRGRVCRRETMTYWTEVV